MTEPTPSTSPPGSAPHEVLRELAALPPEHPRRREFDARAAALPAADRDPIIALAAEYDELRRALADTAAPPAAVTRRLLSVPDRVPRGPWLRRVLLRPAGPLHAAAAVLVAALSVWTYVRWIDNAPLLPAFLTTDPAALSDRAAAVMQEAIDRQAALPPTPQTRPAPELFAELHTESAAARLAAAKLPFTPTLPKPTATDLALVDAGTTTLAGEPAAYTRWRRGDQTLTLYQLAPAALGLTQSFGHASTGCGSGRPLRAELWTPPDHTCTWLLTAPDTFEGNPFLAAY